MTSDEPTRARTARVQELAARHALSAVVLRSPASFAWLTGGADNRVDHTSPVGVASLVVRTSGEATVLTTNIEAARMREESTPGFEVLAHAWEEPPDDLLRRVAGPRIGSDVPQRGEVDVSGDVRRERCVLDGPALRQLRSVGRDAVAAVDAAVNDIQRGMGEHEAAACLSSACRARGLFTPVLLVAADQRITRHRHPIPVGAAIERRAMVVVCAERVGLYANLTRFVDFEPPPADLQRRHAVCHEILRRLREESTRAGRTLSDVLEDCRRFYAEAGFPGEERLHHQGGLTGYAAREVIATPSSSEVIQPGHAFAWNPSITGAKAEETFVLLPDGPEVVAR